MKPSCRRSTIVIALFCLLFLFSGCRGFLEEMRSKLHEGAKARSFRKSSSEGNTSKGCPPGTVPRISSGAGGVVCASPRRGTKGLEAIEQRYANGSLREKVIVGDNEAQIGKWHSDGKPKERVAYKDNEKHGAWMMWYSNGQIAAEGSYVLGKKSGKFAYYYENGSLKQRGRYQKDLKTGIWESYHENGKVSSRETWRRGRREGNSEYFDKRGVLTSHGSYLANKQNGAWAYYYPNGALKTRSNYVNGTLNGKLVEYDATGRLIKTAYYRRGVESAVPQLKGKVTVTARDRLGAAPPRHSSSWNTGRSSRKNRQRVRQGGGWESM